MSNSTPLGVYFLDVGQGDCSFVLPPDDTGAVLFDCNDEHVAERFVQDHKIKHLRAAVISHLDVDHIRGMMRFLRSFLGRGGQVDAFYVGLDGSPRERLQRHSTELVDQALKWDQSGVMRVCPPVRDFNPRLLAGGAGWSVELVLPFYGAQLQQMVNHDAEPNRASAVLRIGYAGVYVLIGGDAPLSSWSRLEAGLGKATIVRTPHHGGEIRDNGGSFFDLYDRAKAELSVVSVGTHNPHGHPHEEHVEAARRGGKCRILCTQLTPRCHDQPLERIAEGVAKASGVVYPYRHHVRTRARTKPEVPCAGSIAVTLDGIGGWSVVPREYGWHRTFVAKLDEPMCL